MNLNFSIRKKMMVFIIGTMILTYVFTLGYITLSLRNQAIEEGWKLVNTAASQKANEISRILSEDIAVARSMATAMEAALSLPADQRTEVRKQIMIGALKSNPKYEAAWMSYELWSIDPAWDKPFGRERATYYLDDGKVQEHIRLDNLNGDPETGLYSYIKQNPQEIIGEPYKFAAYGGKSDELLLGVSPEAPIMVDGKFAGLIGTDMFLDDFESMSEIDFFDRGFAFLVSNKGTVITHENLKYANQPLDSLPFYQNLDFDLKSIIANGETKSFTAKNAGFGKEEVMIAFAPIEIGYSKSPWSAGLEIPTKEITGPIARTFFTTIAVGLIGLVILIIITYKIATSIARSLDQSSEMLQRLSTGDLDAENRLDFKSSDEIGQLAKSANHLMDQLIYKSNFAHQIGLGNLSESFEVSSDRDMLGYALLRMRENLETVINETNAVVKRAGESGELSTARIETAWETGAWKELSDSINSLLDSLANPFKEINHVVNAMAEGDLTVRFSSNVQGDVEVLSNNLNSALDNISDLIKGILAGSKSVADSAVEMLGVNEEMTLNTREIASSISEMSRGAQNQVTKVDESSNLVEGILRSSNQMGDQADKIKSVAQEVSDNSDKGLKLVKKAGFSMRDISAFSGETYNSIQILTDRSNEISSVLSVITDIAAQTNLLALNAAIEAAQAGDAGRGFAVVAEEIRKLAEDSRKSAKEIEKLILDVKKDVSSASTAIEMMKASVQSGEDATKHASDAFNEIYESANANLNVSDEIRNHVLQQIDAIKHVVTITESVVVIAEQTAAGTEEIASSATELSAGMDNYNAKTADLSQVAVGLNERISKFRLS
ncbi:MAG: methyl-accepting chemotaxis protein [Cyclobacteriaceae bacterium]